MLGQSGPVGRRGLDLHQKRPVRGRYGGWMEIPLQISFHGVQHSDALSDTIRQKARGLERYYDRIMSCRVVLELAGRHPHQGKEFVAKIDLKVPGSEIVVTHQHAEDPQVALHQAFDAVRRRLEDFARKQRGDTKKHSPA